MNVQLKFILFFISLGLFTGCVPLSLESKDPHYYSQEFYINNPNSLPVKYFEKNTGHVPEVFILDTVIIPAYQSKKINTYSVTRSDSYSDFLSKFEHLALVYDNKVLIYHLYFYSQSAYMQSLKFQEKTEPYVQLSTKDHPNGGNTQVITFTLNPLIFQ